VRLEPLKDQRRDLHLELRLFRMVRRSGKDFISVRLLLLHHRNPDDTGDL
jgi:hypothetical protein